MLQKTTTFGLLGVLATGAGAMLRSDTTGPEPADPTAGVVVRNVGAFAVSPRVASLERRAIDALSTPAAPGGAAAGGGLPLGTPVDVAVDEAVRTLVESGVRVGAGASARVDDRSGGDVILKVLNDRADAAIACREPSPGEQRRGLGEERLGDLILALVAHPENPVGSLQGPAVREILAGAARDWAPFGGRPGPIKLVLPPPGPRADLYARIVARGDALAGGATLAASDEERIRLVMNDRTALTVVSLEAARRMQVPTLRIDGVPPSLGAFRTGRYGLGTPIVLVHRGTPDAVQLATALRRPEARRALAAHLTIE